MTNKKEALESKTAEYLRKVTSDLLKTRNRLRRLEDRYQEPIAIVGIGCRFPGGVASAQDLWRVVVEGTDAVSPFPTDRGWPEDLYDPDPDATGKSYAFEGGFLHEAAQFDAGFFGISPREAAVMDPQQRLLLEVAWETLENAGIDPAVLKGTDTGVYVGQMYHDYVLNMGANESQIKTEGTVLTGNAGSVTSGRVAYNLGLLGPAVTVDTACSSTLVAMHLAVQALRSGECSMALAGGATVMSTPATFVEFSRQRGLARDGRCKSFSAAADGTGWSEGVGLLLVQRLSDARREGRRVLAVIRGSAVNQDGASNGLSAPNGPSQQRVITQALANARVSADQVDVVEAHGTGTKLGDPIEAGALLATYGQTRPTDAEGVVTPLWLGSVKSNIGHTQAAAGAAGMIKMVMALQHGVLPRTLHVDAPSPHIDWDAGAVRLLTESTEWPVNGHPRTAAVSSFGISGTNAHLILQQAPAADPVDSAGDGGTTTPLERSDVEDPVSSWVFTVSGKSEQALVDQAARLREHVHTHPESGLTDLAYSLATTRTHHPYRAAITVDPDTDTARERLLAVLGALESDRPDPQLVHGVVGPAGRGATVFVFPGQGAQHLGMGMGLYQSYPAFRTALDDCDAALAPFTGWSLLAVLRGEPDAPSLDRVDVVQPALFAIMVSLAALWDSIGITPDAVIGHSQGEIAAAHVAGALSLRDAAKVVALRSRALIELAGTGTMASVLLAAELLRELLDRWNGAISIAAVNGPANTTVAGDNTAIAELLAHCAEHDIQARLIPVDYPAHSARIDQLRDRLLTDLVDITPQAPTIAFRSTVDGEPNHSPHTLDAEYWCRNLRETVRFHDAVTTLLERGQHTFVELSAHPILTASIAESIEDHHAGTARADSTGAGVGMGSVAIATLRKNHPDTVAFTTALARVHVHGHSPDWTRVFSPRTSAIALPTYAFQHQRYWLNAAPITDVTSAGLDPATHPLLGAVTDLGEDQGWVFTGQLSLRAHPWLVDHSLFGTAVVPGAGLVDLALHAGHYTGYPRLAELALQAPLSIPEHTNLQLRITVTDTGDALDERRIVIRTRPDTDGGGGERPEWTLHATGRLTPDTGVVVEPWAATWPPAGIEQVDQARFYQNLSDLGYDYGPMFQGLRTLWRSLNDSTVYAEVELPAGTDTTGYSIHPALLDAALHLLGTDADVANGDVLVVPFAFAGVSLHATDATALRVRMTRTGPETVALHTSDSTGAPVATVESLTVRRLSPEALHQGATRQQRPTLLHMSWSPAPTPDTTGVFEAGRWAVLSAGPVEGALGALAVHRDLDALLEVGPLPEVVVWPVPTHDGVDVPARIRAVTGEALSLLQAWTARPELAGVRLLMRSRGAVTVGPHDRAPDLAQAAVWGLTRSTQTEHPNHPITLLDLDTPDTDIPVVLAGVLATSPHETQLALRGDTIHIPRLVPAAVSGSQDSFVFDGEGTVLITGGTGTLGGLLAEHLVTAHGVRHLWLVSRRGSAAPGAAELAGRLSELGAEVTISACDIGDRDAVAALLASIPSRHRLTAVVHTAGVLADAPLADLTAERLDRVLAAKTDAAWHLHELTADLDLAAFVLYSSVAGVLGGAGQGNYAAANTALDALAEYRRGLGLPATSLVWGYWATASGMTGHLSGADTARIARSGLSPVTDQAGLAMFDAALDSGVAVLAATPVNTRALTQQAHEGTLAPVLSALVTARPRASAGRSVDPSAVLISQLAALTSEQRHRHLTDLVRDTTATLLGHPTPDTVGPDQPFKDLGIDSLTALELRNTLSRGTGLSLTATLIFDHPTPHTLAKHLAERLTPTTTTTTFTPAAAVGVGTDEPVAVVGMACRFPGGVAGPQDLWDLVVSGSDAVGEFPTDRGWDLEGLFDPDPDAVGKSYARHGGFLREAAGFDAAFFGISPREALSMDPQQRLLLEVCWEALEAAGIDPAGVAGSDTGVFTGIWSQEYGSAGSESAEGYSLTGTATSVASGRIAYTLGLQGPAITVDTACSSSLVAAHLACQSLRSGESSLALAGGVTVMATPRAFSEFSRQRGLARDGRCKSFAAAADGTGWGEGSAVLVLQRLSDARREGRRVLAVIRGSAVNQDGASNGLSAPNGPSQQRVITQALANARVSADQVDVVEAHGTGTKLGDPIEAGALLATYGQTRPTDAEGVVTPLWLGSVKSNIGHTQAAAGAAGMIKMVMALQHGVLPRTLHVDAPSPHIDWDAGAVRLLTESTEWPVNGHPRTAAVSSFGISGTNAHLILQQAPAADPVDSAGDGGTTTPLERSDVEDPVSSWVFTVSGKSEQALVDQAARLREHVHTHPESGLTDLAYSLATTRTHHPYRAAITVDPDTDTARERLLAVLGALESDRPDPQLVHGVVGPAGRGATVFVFPGQGAQHLGMGMGLYQSYPAFRTALDDCDAALAPFTGWSLLAVLRGEPDAPSLDRVDVVQPALFAIMVSLAALWDSIGITPDAVIGHSQGEIAAAHVAGALSLRDAAKVVALRSRALIELAGTGTMASVLLAAELLRELLDRWNGAISIAAVNGPANTTVAGDNTAIAELLAHCAEHDIQARLIPVDYPAHSARIDQLRDRLLTDLVDITPQAPTIAFRSTVDGEPNHSPHTLDAEYWCRNLRETVRFHDAVTTLLERGQHTFVELSAHPILTASIAESIEDHHAGTARADSTGAGVGMGSVAIATLRKNHPDTVAFTTALARVHVHGHSPDWTRVFSPRTSAIALPTYAFQHQRYWLNAAPITDVTSAGLDPATHPLLGAVTDLGEDQGWVFTGQLSLRAHPWLVDHSLFGTAVVPGAGLVDLALHAGHYTGYPRLAELALQAPLSIPEHTNLQLRITVTDTGDALDERRIVIRTRPDTDGGGGERPEWTLHATGRLTPDTGVVVEPWAATWPPAGIEQVDQARFYQNLSDLGYDYGPMFQGLRTLWRSLNDSTVYAEVELPAGTDTTGYSIHPALLDAALHLLGTDADVANGDVLVVPFAFAGVSLHATDATALRVRMTRTGPETVALHTSDSTGAPVATVESLTVRRLSPEALHQGATRQQRPTLLHMSWSPAPTPDTTGVFEAGRWAVLSAGPVEGALGALAVHRDLDALLEVGPLPEVVVWPVPTHDGVDVPARIRAVTGEALSLLQAWTARPELAGVRLLMRSRGAVTVGPHDRAPDLAQAAVWGLTRSTQTEHPNHPITLLDLDTPDTDIPVVLAGVLATSPHETQLALRGDTIHIPRLTHTHALVPPETDSWRLDTTGKGHLAHLALLPVATTPLAEGQIRIQVRAAGLNFRDVVIALGLIDDEGLGAEAAGVITEIGPGVDDLAVGDEVMGIFADAFAPTAVTDHRMVIPIPPGWSFAQAASVPAVFLTAYPALVDIAGLTRGQRVLIHAGAGGVGIAAIQLAHHLGAEVFATASRHKWGVLRALGIPDDHIASSRTLDFADTFLEVTDGAGMDVILDCLAGEFVDASLRLLPNGGQFVEIGKTDIRDPDHIATVHPNVTYRTYDLAVATPDDIQRTFAHLEALFAAATLTPLPITGYDLRQAQHAFRDMSAARHTGKIVLTTPHPFDGEGTVLITGGTGTLGGLLAEHLVTAHGVRHLWLVSRRGSAAPGAAELAGRLSELGAEVTISACDIGDGDAVAALLASIPSRHRLTAVVHTAGVLADAPLADLTAERLDRVLAAKTDAAWHLHELTADLDLAAFVLYSSVAGVLGGAGQGNYAAANTALDALAEYRRGLGLPATSLVWGYWATASGMTGHLSGADTARIARSGLSPVTDQAGLAMFDAALDSGVAVLAATPVNTRALTQQAHEGTLAPVLSALVTARPRASAGRSVDPSAVLISQLAALTSEQRHRHLTDLVRDTTATLLGHPTPDTVGPDQPFKDLGIDSLTALELRNTLSRGTGLSLTATLIFDHPTPHTLAKHLAERLTPDESSAAAPVYVDLARVDALLNAASGAAKAEHLERLQEILSKHKGPEDDSNGESVTARLRSSTYDDLFEFLDNELGI
ncbi:SDR family NAD(P)-dependent oxidoreductase [Nocardia sp. NBC_01377]|uniref:SDR family NAD(P)-dependent oxidoreductase n=1 Tax=Nocardia sp. NBC_01377 TaxID=2903595 RepID=UPI00325063F5